MEKLWLIIKREYLSRVTKKTFILATILTPLAIGLIGVVAGYFASNDTSEKRIAIVDQSGYITPESIGKSSSYTYEFPSKPIESLRESYTEEGYDVLIDLPRLSSLDETKLDAVFYSKDKMSLIALEGIEEDLDDAYERYKYNNSGIEKSKLDALKMKVSLENGKTDEDGVGDSSSKMAIVISTALSYIMGFLMYMVIFIYGSMVMRSVMEEKISRIVEVMISTVKPFQLMLGKITGVGLVGLTQLAIWIVLIPIIMMVVSSVFGLTDVGATGEAAQVIEQLEQAEGGKEMIAEVLMEIRNMNWTLIIPVFIIFFLGGYFIYSSLFAAIGSAMGDDLGEGQQMMLPITIPVILAFVMIPSVFNNPNGTTAVFGSMFPLFSPILMPARLPFDPPLWQVLLSIVILIASIVFFAWLAGRIYRVGILMYGKKVSFKEIGKWIFYKG